MIHDYAQDVQILWDAVLEGRIINELLNALPEIDFQADLPHNGYVRTADYGANTAFVQSHSRTMAPYAAGYTGWSTGSTTIVGTRRLTCDSSFTNSGNDLYVDGSINRNFSLTII